MNRLLLFYKTLVLFFCTYTCFADTDEGKAEIKYDAAKKTFLLRNNLFKREILADEKHHNFYTIVFKDSLSDYNYIVSGSQEFYFKLNGSDVSGNTGHWDYTEHIIYEGKNNAKILTVTLKGLRQSITENLILNIHYEIYPDMPVVRKWMVIKNTRDKEIKITDLEWENLKMMMTLPEWRPGFSCMSQVYAHYGQTMFHPPYKGSSEDPALLVFKDDVQRGYILGNESPAIQKHIDV